MKKLLLLFLLIIGITKLQAKDFGYYLIHSTKEDYNNSVLPGGYIGFGISIGKNNQNRFYWDTQITGAMHMISFTKGNTFLGFTLGRRIANKKRMTYLDFQVNYWSVIQMGYGRGWLYYDNKRIPRKKMWLGSALPIILTFDNYMLDKELVKQKGLMFSLPLPIYGKTFYPG